MKVSEHLKKARKEERTIFSLEVLPPLKGQGIGGILNTVENLLEFSPSFINVTSHRSEYETGMSTDGTTYEKIIRKRPGTIGVCSAIQNKYKIDTVPHVLCGGFSREETEDFLIEANYLQIENIMALRGDALKTDLYFKPTEGGNKNASDLVTQVKGLNQGKYLSKDLKENFSTDFCVGVAGYPEKHFEATNLDIDIQNLKKKIDCGAEFIITQMFFDNNKYFSFVERCRAEGIGVPIIPALKPFATKKQLELIPEKFYVHIPSDLKTAILNAKDNAQVRQIGAEWAIQQSKELKQKGVEVIHLYSMGKSDNVKAIAKEIF